MDKFMASISAVPPRPQDILQEAGPWGGIQEELHAKEWGGAGVAAGMPLRYPHRRVDRATRPWLELLRCGNVSVFAPSHTANRPFAKTGSGRT